MAEPESKAKYAVNPETGQVMRNDGTGWQKVKTAKNEAGDILINEGGQWAPLPGKSSAAPSGFAAPAKMPFAQAIDAASAQGREFGLSDESAGMRRMAGVPEWADKAINATPMGTAMNVGLGLGGLATEALGRESPKYTEARDASRAELAQARTDRPITSFTSELATGAAYPGGALKMGAPILKEGAKLGAIGAVQGGLYGYAAREGDTEDRADGGKWGAAIGGTVGAVTPASAQTILPAVRSAKETGASIYDALNGLVGRQSGARDKVAEDVAIAAVRRSMERSGMTLPQVMNLVKRYEGKPAVLAEVLGQDAINALTALTRRPGSTPQKAQGIIEERFYGRPDRMKADVEDVTGIQIGQLDETLTAQLGERRAAAKPLYDALYKRYGTIKSFGESLKRVNRLKRTPTMQRHLDLAEKAIRTRAGVRGVPISKMSTMEYWDLVKQSLDDAIGSAVSKGEQRTRVGESVQELTALKDELVTELDRLTGGAYAAAREAGGEAPRLAAAASAGKKALQARNPRDVAKTVAATLAQDMPALRAGMVDDLGTRIDKGMTPGRVRVQDVAGKLRAGLGEDSANKLIGRLDAEATLSETGARWAPRMNSVTGTVMESGATAMGDDLVNAGVNLATGNQVGLFRQAINFMRQRGFSQRQIDAIGDLLLSSPEEGLRRLKLMAPDGAPPAVGNAFSQTMSSQQSTPTGNAFTTPTPTQRTGIGTRAADATAVGVIATGGPTAQADTGDPQKRLEELSQQETAAQQLIADYEQGLKDFQSLSVVEKQRFLRDNGFTGQGGAILKDDGATGGNTTYAINNYTKQMSDAIAAAKAERENARGQINQVRVGMAERQENPPNPLFDKAAELGTYAAMIYGAHRLRGAATKGSQKSARLVAADANALLTRLPVPPQPPNRTLLSRVPVVGSKEKARITKATNAANKAAMATEDRLSGRNIPPISPDPTSPDGLPTRTANLQEFDRRQAAGDFGPAGSIGRMMEPINSRVRAGDVGVIGAGAADAYIMEGMLEKTRADIAAEETRLDEARKANNGLGDPDRIQASNDRLEQLRKAETVQTILQRVGVGLMIGGTVGLAHGRYSRPQPRYEAANRERELIGLARNPPPPPANAFAPTPPPKKPRTVGKQKPKPKPPVSINRGRPPKAENDNN